MGEITNNTKSLRINIPVNRKEYRTVLKAAKVMCVKPAEFGREAIKRAARQVLKRAGISVRLDMDDYMKEGPEAEEAHEENLLPANAAITGTSVEPPARYDPTPIAPEAPVEPEDDWEGEA